MVRKLVIFLFLLIQTHFGFTQNPWTQKAPFGGGPRAATVGFSIGHYGFIGCGTSIPIWNYAGATNDFWKWDVYTDTWTQIANYPGASWELETGFTIEGKGYVCFGWAGTYASTDMWRYDTITNAWTQMANFPGQGRYDVSDFVIGHKVYIIEGNPAGPPYFSDVWVYDAHTNAWKQLNNFPVPNLEGVVAFSIGNHGYAGDGYNNPGCSTSMFEYDTTSDTWTPMAPIPVPYGDGGNSTNCTLGSRGYIFNGDKCNVPGVPTGYMYDTITKAWCAFTDMSKSTEIRAFTSAFVVNNHIYMGTGYDTAFHNLGDFLEYTPSTKLFAKDTNLCINDSVRFSDSSTYLGNSWAWSFPGGHPSTSNLQNPSVYYTTSGSYTVKLILTACGGGDTVTRIITVISGTSGSYTITGHSPICAGTMDTITASGGGTYKWSNGATSSSIIVSPANTTTYSVHIAGGCNSKDTSITINVNPVPNLIIANPNDTICRGDFVSLNVSGADTYLWTPSSGLTCSTCPNPTATPTISTSYLVIGTDTADGCSTTKNVSVVVSTGPVMAAIPDQTICEGNQVTLVADEVSGFDGTFVWQPGGSTNTLLDIYPSTTTTYTVNYTNKCGTTSTTVTVFVNPAPIPKFSADITQGCAPLCIQFRDLCTINAGNINMWRWTFGNGDTADIESPIYCYPDTGTFTPALTATSTDGCSATLKIVDMITVFSKPVANFIYSPNPVNFLEPAVQFTDASKDAYGLTYWTWSFGDQQPSTSENSLRNPNHTYHDTGTYCPQLVVMNNKGCVDTITNCLEVYPIFTLYIPSAFSPNGDGVNDFFTAKGDYLKHFEMYIFDRWGMELYHTTDINQGWNGTVKSGSVICQEDSYVYSIIATDWSNEKHSYVGEFTLIK